MNPWIGAARNERGVALPLALIALVVLTGLVLVFLSMSAVEPQVARNLSDATRARYMAEAGMELAFNQLAGTLNWSTTLQGMPADGQDHPDNTIAVSGVPGQWTALTPFGPGLIQQPLPGLAATDGTYTVVVRNDYVADPSDTQLTGEPVDGGGRFTNNNGNIIVLATGTVNGVTRRVQAVIARIPLLPFDGAFVCPGVKCEVVSGPTSHTHIDGRDHTIADLACPGACAATGTAPVKYAITTLDSSKEAGVEASGISEGLQELDGKDQYCLADPCAIPPPPRPPSPPDPAVPFGQILRWNGEGARTVAPTTMTQGNIQAFLNKVRTLPSTNLINIGPTAFGANDGVSTPPVNFGTSLEKSTITWIKGLGPTDVNLNGNTVGNGLLIIEDGQLRISGSFRWNGLVIVTGPKAEVRFENFSQSLVYGGLMVNDTDPTGSDPNYWVAPSEHGSYPDPGSQFTGIYASQQTLDQVQTMVSLMRIYSWREI